MYFEPFEPFVSTRSITQRSGFGLSGIPENIIEYVREQPEITDLKIISTEAGDNDWGLGRLYEKDKISKQWASYIGRCKVMEQAYLNGKTELELIPQGIVSSFFPRLPMLKLIVVASRESPLLRFRDSRLLLCHWIAHPVCTRQATNQVQI